MLRPEQFEIKTWDTDQPEGLGRPEAVAPAASRTGNRFVR